MRLLRMIGKPALVAACVCLSSASVALGAIDLPIVNPGAEAGDTSGWVNPEGIWNATNSPPDARAGSWYFETSEFLDVFQTRELRQMIDVSAYAGAIEEVTLSVSMAAGQGYAEDLDGEPQTWDYYAHAALRFFDANLYPLPVSRLGSSVAGDPSLPWFDLTMTWNETTTPGWDGVRSDIAYIEVGLAGIWVQDDSFITDPPPSAIQMIPEGTRFDEVAVTVVTPEPATACMLGLGLVALIRRKR